MGLINVPLSLCEMVAMLLKKGLLHSYDCAIISQLCVRATDYKQFWADKTSSIVLCIVADTKRPCCSLSLLGAIW